MHPQLLLVQDTLASSIGAQFFGLYLTLEKKPVLQNNSLPPPPKSGLNQLICVCTYERMYETEGIS